MKVNLMSYTPDALNLLLRTKNTRLTNNDDPVDWSEEKRAEHLRYMLTTIKSSWEFVDYTFEITGVTRAFTHELVRHRHGSYAQQSQRVVDVRDSEVIMPASIANTHAAPEAWNEAVASMKETYGALMDAGIPTQDARGLVPTNISTNIVAKFSLRSLHEMAKIRLCTRATGEFQDVMRAMKDEVVSVHQWAVPFINVQCVADGTCAFPRYGKAECPVWFPALDREAAMMKAALLFNAVRYSANPKAKGGLT